MKGKLRNPNLILEEVPEAERSQNQNEEEEAKDDGIPFTKKMRIETRKIHNISDTLVNAKLGLAMSDEKIWAEGLLIFYEIFKFLEAAVTRLSLKSHPTNQHFARFKSVISGIERTNAFEVDLDFYFGPGYLTQYSIRPSVAEYLSHLQTLEEREPLRLLAYLYHLYMGLLSGGQILKRKRDLRNRFKKKVHSIFQWFGFGITPSSGKSLLGTPLGQPKPGDAITYFGDGRTISDIKKDMKDTMDDIASSDLSADEKNSLLEESLEVFRRNNEIVGSIQRTGLIAIKNYAMFFIFITSIGTAIYWYLFSY